MENKTECEIVQDLLLGYVDDTLNNESKVLVEKHIVECENCIERLKEIKEDIKQNESKQQKEIDYLKKIRRKSKIKSIMIAIGIILTIVLGIYINKFIKINSIMSKLDKSLKSQNYYSEMHQILNNGKVAVDKLYYKDGKYKIVSGIYSEQGNEIEPIVYGKVGTDERVEINEKEKSVLINKGEISKIFNKEEAVKWCRFSHQERHSLIANLGKAFILSIITDTYRYGKEYYILRNQFEQSQRWEIWIDKETGLVIREINKEGEETFITGSNIVKGINDRIQEYKHEFDIVTDEDIQIPDYSDYKVEQINEEFSNYMDNK